MKNNLKLLALLPLLLVGISCSSQEVPVTELDKYTVTFESNGGTKYKDVIVNEGDSVRLPTPEKTDYEFLGWYDNNAFTGNTYSGLYTPVSDFAFYAKWEQVVYTYTVHFECDGINDIEVKSNNNVIDLPIADVYGYHFNGWQLREGGEVFTGNFTVNSDLIFYPSFKEVSYVYCYLNESTDLLKLEFDKYGIVQTESLPSPDPCNIEGYDCPFIKWVDENGNDLDTELLLGDDPVIIIATYDHSVIPAKINLKEIGEGIYETTGRGIKDFYQAESVYGIWSTTIGVYKANSGATGIAFRMTNSGADYAFEDENTSYISATLGASGSLSVAKVENGAYKSIKTLALENLPAAHQENVNSNDYYFETTLTVFSLASSFTIYIDGEVAYVNSDEALLSSINLQGTGFGYRSSASNYRLSNMKYETGTKINLNPNGGNPFEEDTYYWPGAKVLALPNATTSIPNRVFDAWYYDAECQNIVDLTNPQLDEDTILYAGYRTPISSKTIVNEDNTVTLTAKTVDFIQEVEYERYSVETNLTFSKAQSGSFGLFIRGNITSDDSYEVNNSFVAIQMLPNSGGFQFSKTGNGSNFSQQSLISVSTGTSVKSPVAVSAISEAWANKYASAVDEVNVNLKVEDYDGMINIYIDGEKVFYLLDTSTLFTGLDGTGIGFKTSAANVKFSMPVVNELEDQDVEITLIANGGELESDKVSYNMSGLIALPTPTKINRVFEGWYYDEQLTNEVNASAFDVTISKTLYAKYRLPTNSKYVDNGDGTITLTGKTTLLVDEVSYNKYSVETTLSYTKGTSGSYGLFVRGNITSDDSYEANNSFLAFQISPSSGTFFQFSKTGNGASFAHQSLTSQLTSSTVKSPIKNAACFTDEWKNKYENAVDGEVITSIIKIEDLSTSMNIYLDGVLVFTLDNVSSISEGLVGKGIGFKTSATNVTFSTPVINEIK